MRGSSCTIPRSPSRSCPGPAIRPYPTEYVWNETSRDGRRFTIRPIRPDDEPLLIAFHGTLSEESVRLRYLHPFKLDQRTAHERLIRTCFVDYDREMALVAEVAFHLWPARNRGRRAAQPRSRRSQRRGVRVAGRGFLAAARDRPRAAAAARRGGAPRTHDPRLCRHPRCQRRDAAPVRRSSASRSTRCRKRVSSPRFSSSAARLVPSLQ